MIMVFGAGKILRQHADKLNMDQVLCFVDNNAGQDKLLYGKKIIKPERIKEHSYEYIVLFLDKASMLSEVRSQLWQLGVPDDKIVNWTYYLFEIQKKAKKISNDIAIQIKYVINELDIESIVDVHSSLIKQELYIRDNNAFVKGVEYVDYLPQRADTQRNYSRTLKVLQEKFDAAIMIDEYIYENAENIKKMLKDLANWCRYIIFTVPYLCPKRYSDINDLKWEFKKFRVIKLEYSELVIVDTWNDLQENNAKIFTVAHKKFTKPNKKNYETIYVGDYQEDDCLKDNVGDNIAALNPLINECTAIYWIWKNYNCKYVGITHYRRYFEIGNFWEEQDDNLLDGWYIEKYLRKYDMITLRSTNGFPNSVKDVLKYSISENAFEKAYFTIRTIISDKYPEYMNDFDQYFDGYVLQNCNMFVCTKSIYDRYCEWLFSIIVPACKMVDLSGEDSQSIRAIGYVAERLLSLWICHNKIYVKELPLQCR